MQPIHPSKNITTLPASNSSTISKQLLTKMQHIRLIALDVDGILSDGKIIYDANGVETKAFYVQDGVGIKALQKYGVTVAIITGRNSPMVSKRAAELDIQHIVQGRDDKGVALSQLAQQLDIPLNACAYMGDDLPDISALKLVGFAASVPNAHDAVKPYADYISSRQGGYGAVREVADMILQAIGCYDAMLAEYT